MKDESRIEALELELKILKNEIQSTLLEIREQILNHYYPELRADEPLHSHSLPVRPPQSRPGLPTKNTPRTPDPTSTLADIEAKGHVQPFSDIFLNDLDDEEDDNNAGRNNLVNSRRIAPLDIDLDDDDDDDYSDDEDHNAGAGSAETIKGIKVQKVGPSASSNFGVTPQTREVDFRQLKQAAAGAKPTPPPAPVSTPMKTEAPVQKASRPNFAALATWVGNGISTVGKERTTQIINTYVSGGKLSEETKNSLLQLVALAGDEEPANPVGSQEMLSLMVALDQILDPK